MVVGASLIGKGECCGYRASVARCGWQREVTVVRSDVGSMSAWQVGAESLLGCGCMNRTNCQSAICDCHAVPCTLRSFPRKIKGVVMSHPGLTHFSKAETASMARRRISHNCVWPGCLSEIFPGIPLSLELAHPSLTGTSRERFMVDFADGHLFVEWNQIGRVPESLS